LDAGEPYGRSHFLEEVEPVVGGGTVGGDTDADPCGEHVVDPCGARSVLHVRAWAVGDGHFVASEDVDVVIRHPHRMCSQDIGLEESQRLHVLGD
jgi:hypothetical protein